jgi:multicomponent Na+:H+ antiporter subunit E
LEAKTNITGRKDASSSESSGTSRPKRFTPAVILTFFILFILWITFSGRFDLFHLILGLISCAIVSVFCRDFLFSTPTPGRGTFLLWLRFLDYIPWLLYQILLANLHVLYLVLHPRMMDRIDPHIIEFDSRLKSDYGRTTFADSITLTPGTITVNVTELGRFFVHCIDTRSGEALPGEMETRIAKVFKE